MTVWVAVQFVDAAGASVATSQATEPRSAFGSLTTISFIVRLPVLVTTIEYVTMVPTAE